MRLRFLLPVSFLVLMAAMSAGSSSPLPTGTADAQPDGMEGPGGVDWDALCDHHTKVCEDRSPEDLGGQALTGVVLTQPAVPVDYLVDGLLQPAPASHNSHHDDAGNGRGGGQGQDNPGNGQRPDDPGNGGGNGRDAGSSVTQVPCGPFGCPDLIVDSTMLLNGGIFTQNFTQDDCNVVEGSTEAGERRILRFTFTTPNFGEADLFVGNPEDHPEWFEWGVCHGHHHFREYADYRLWTVEGYLVWQQARQDDPNATAEEVFEANPGLQDQFVAGHKQGFCVIDITWYNPLAPQKYISCFNQGISPGWADQYTFSLDGQFIDITDVEPGLYVLEAEVNAERLFEESDYTNNGGAVLIPIHPQDATNPTPPPLPPVDHLLPS